MTLLWRFPNPRPQLSVYSGKMEAMRETWTDERMDDLARHVDAGFHESREDLRSFRLEVKTDLVALRSEMESRFDKTNASVDARFDKVDARFEALNSRFDALQRLMIAALLTFILSLFLDRL
jgi:hypothetical protein